MMPTPDPLETDLSSLIPRQPSPGFRRRLGARLAHAPRAKSRRLWWLAVSTGLAAACLAALLWWRPGSGKAPEQVQRTPPRPQVGVEETAPTVLACQRALARSPEELDAFLSRQAVVAVEGNPEPEPIRAFTRSDEILHRLIGDD